MQLIAARINWCSVTLGVGHRVADCGTGFFGIRGWAAIPDIRRLPHSALVTTRSRLQMTKCHGRVQVLVQLQPQRATIETTRLSNHNHNVPQGSIWQSRVGTPVAGVVGLAEEHPGDRPGDTNGRHGDELDHQRDRT